MNVATPVRNRADEDSDYSPIAIVGIGCRFPGGIESPKTFWDFLLRGGDGTCEAPPSRWAVDDFYDPDPEAIGKIYVRRGGFLTGDVEQFDPQFFGISPREASYMDPQQRLLLEVTWEAFEDAAIRPSRWAHHKVGVFIGLFTHDFENLHMRLSEEALTGPHSATGVSTTIAANRLSHAFDFTGPSMVIDTACSSSLVAVHLACRALHNGEAEVALAGGVNLQLMPDLTAALCKASMLAPDGRCKSFDAGADGYARADGAGMVLLKRLGDAVADGDDIYAVVHGSAVNQDGRSKGITVPSGESQMQVMRDALDLSGAGPRDISYVEAHGTGTPVGDPIEANALGTVLSDVDGDRAACLLGSVKSNFGHTESAAGIAGLIKLALMQRHGQIPPNLHFETPNPHIPFEDLKLRVPTEVEDWQADEGGMRLAAINSFGFGGTNAHAIVGPAPERPIAPGRSTTDDGATLFCLSARSKDALKANAQQYADFLRSEAGGTARLGDVAAAVVFGREHHGFRLAAAAKTHAEAISLLEAHTRDLRPAGLVTGTANADPDQKLAFVFSGMGQQWWAMGRRLIEGEPVFTDKVDELDALFARHGDGLSVREILSADEDDSEVDRTEFAQPAIFAVQVALASLYASRGVRPDVVVGHSVGEVAAAHVAGALSLEDAVKVCVNRSRLQATLAGRGGMLAVGLPQVDAEQYIRHLGDVVSVAAINSPNSVTLAGDVAALEDLAETLAAEDIFARVLNVEVPYHSPVMDEIAERFAAAITDIEPGATTATYISTVTGEVAQGEELGAAYWNRNVREPVAFAQAMQTLADLEGSHLIVEIGAHPVLATSISECFDAAGQAKASITSLRRKQDDVTTFMSAIGQLYCQGFALPLDALFERPANRIELPTYPWQRTFFWTESGDSRRRRIGAAAEGGKPSNPLLGARQSTPNPSWKSQVGHDRPAFLNDHQVQGEVVFPAAGFAEIGLAAAAEVHNTGSGVALEGLKIAAPLILTSDARSELQMSVNGDHLFEIHARRKSRDETYWHRHAVGRLATAEPVDDEVALSEVRDRLSIRRDQEEIYRHLDGIGLQYGEQFRCLEATWIGDKEVLGQIALTDDIEADLERFCLHPAILDASFQLLAALPGDGTYLPVSINRLDLVAFGRPVAWAYGRVVGKSELRITADIVLMDDEGGVVAKVSGLSCQLFESDRRTQSILAGAYIHDRLLLAEPLDQDAPERRIVAHLPSPAALAPALQERHRERLADNGQLAFRTEGTQALGALAIGYFIEALHERGWTWADGETFTAESLTKDLGISLRHMRFVQCMLEHLADAGYLGGDATGWHLTGDPAGAAPGQAWATFVRTYPGNHAEASLVHKIGSRLARFLGDDEEPMSALFASGSTFAEQFYADAPVSRPYNQVMAEAALAILDELPAGETLKILEVGVGTGGLTSYLLPLLPPAQTKYVCTDASESALKHARDKFRDYHFVDYETFDPEQGGAPQEFTPGAFDLIVTSNTIHATVDVRATLTNLNDLLAPGGLLAFVESTIRSPWEDLLMGLLPGWWVFGDTDLRRDHALLTGPAWMSAMAASGFEDCAEVTDGLKGGASLQSVMLGRKPMADLPEEVVPAEPDAADGAAPAPAVLLSDDLGVAEALRAVMQERGYDVTVVGAPRTNGHDTGRSLDDFANDDSGAQPVIVDLRALAPAPTDDKSAPADIGTATCQRVQALARQFGDRGAKVWIVTNGAEATGTGDEVVLAHAPVRGFARVLMNERPDLNVRLVDLSVSPTAADIAALGREIAAESAEDEVALRDGRRFVARFAASRNVHLANGVDSSYRVDRVSPIPPLDLVYRETTLPPPAPGEVQVRVHAAGLNFKDFATYSGLVDTGSTKIGLEGAGIVTAVGEGVERFKVGDAVVGPMENSLSSPINTAADVLGNVPSNLSLAEAAGTPSVFLSAYHALAKLARLAPGETVMVHTGASGFGLAAIQVARALGATVVATAGSEEKRAYLRGLGIDYVGDSRTAKFADEVMEHTGGRGIDVVLNTLAAARNVNNIDILRAGTGRLIDLSNIHYDAKLDYGALKKGVSVSAFDLNIIMGANPDYIRELAEETKALFESGDLSPIPYRLTPLSQLAETVEGFKKASHIGKIVVSLADSPVDVQPRSDDLELRKDGSYLVTGGLTGFGLATAKWLASKGAKSLVLVGRRGADTPGIAEELEAFEAMDVDARAVACDVTDRQQVADLVATFDGEELPPLRGVVHAAVVLRDKSIDDLTVEDIRVVLAAKAEGAWNLHLATRDLPLDFFAMYSSASNIVGNWNQANYAAANEYLEALARYRRSNGMHGLAIGWGAINETGELARDQEVRDLLARQGVHDLDMDKAWAALSYGLRSSSPYISAGTLDWSLARGAFTTVSKSPRFSFVRDDRGGHAGAGAQAVLDANLTPEERREIVHEIVVAEVAAVLGLDPSNLDIDHPLEDLGFDSLMAVELQVAVEKATGYSIQRMALLRPNLSAADLIDEIAGTAGEKRPEKEVATKQDSDDEPVPAESDIRVEEMSDSEVDELLKELAAGE